MTREEFINVLDEKGYSYEIQGDKIVVTRVLSRFEWSGDGALVDLDSLTSLPPGVVFRNGGSVYLDSLTSLPPGVVFRNGGRVDLRSLTSLLRGAEFRNVGPVNLDSITSLPRGISFENGNDVRLESLIGGWFGDWEGNIEGIDRKRILNKMIKDGVFER
jgi:hypothetical protein